MSDNYLSKLFSELTKLAKQKAKEQLMASAKEELGDEEFNKRIDEISKAIDEKFNEIEASVDNSRNNKEDITSVLKDFHEDALVKLKERQQAAILSGDVSVSFFKLKTMSEESFDYIGWVENGKIEVYKAKSPMKMSLLYVLENLDMSLSVAANDFSHSDFHIVNSALLNALVASKLMNIEELTFSVNASEKALNESFFLNGSFKVFQDRENNLVKWTTSVKEYTKHLT